MDLIELGKKNAEIAINQDVSSLNEMFENYSQKKHYKPSDK